MRMYKRVVPVGICTSITDHLRFEPGANGSTLEETVLFAVCEK